MGLRKIIDVIQLILIIFSIIFGLFILYQVILKVLGGSWTTEAIIISFLFLLISIVFTIALNQIRFSVDYNYLKKYIYNFVKDFREFKEKMSEELKDIKSKL